MSKSHSWEFAVLVRKNRAGNKQQKTVFFKYPVVMSSFKHTEWI